MRCYHTMHKGKKHFIPCCWDAVVYGAWACSCYPKKPKQCEKVNTIEIFEKRVKVELTDVVYREFGEDFVKFYDKESGKYFEVVVREYKPVVKKEPKQPEFKKKDTLDLNEYRKIVRNRGKIK